MCVWKKAGFFATFGIVNVHSFVDTFCCFLPSFPILNYERQGQAIVNRESKVLFRLFLMNGGAEEKDTGFPRSREGQIRGLCIPMTGMMWQAFIFYCERKDT